MMCILCPLNMLFFNFISHIDESTVAVEVHLHMSKREMTGKFEFKFCVEERRKKQYEYFGDQYHVHCNRLLDPNLSYIYNNKGNIFQNIEYDVCCMLL